MYHGKQQEQSLKLDRTWLKLTQTFENLKVSAVYVGKTLQLDIFFECDDDLTIDMYNEIMKDGGPKEEKTVLEEYAARIQMAVQQRTQVKKIMEQYG